MTEIYNELCNTFPKKLTENFWLLGNYYFNLYLIKGEKKSAMVEVGVSAIVDTVIDQIESLNIYPDYLIITHPHPDHLTGLTGLQDRFPDARVVAGEGAQKFMEHPKAIDVLIFEDQFMNQTVRAKVHEPDRPPLTQPPILGNYLQPKNGDEINLGGLTLRFLDLKGHCPGNLGTCIPEISALTVSDSLGFHYPKRGIFPVFFTGFHDYMAELDRLDSINANILCPGHQGPLIGADVKKAFQVARQSAFDFLERIIKNQKNKESFAEIIFHEIYVDEYTMYSDNNVRGAAKLLVRRGIEAI